MNSTSAPPSKFIVGNPGRPPQAPCRRYDGGDDDAEMITIINIITTLNPMYPGGGGVFAPHQLQKYN